MIKLPDDFEELISELADTDGVGSAISIYDDKLAKLLVEKELADRNVRGSYYGTPLLRYMYYDVARCDIDVIVDFLN